MVRINQKTNCLWTSVIGYFDGSNEHYFEASVPGDIADSPRGTNGYDWDTIFIPKGQNRTFAEMLPEEKQKYALTQNLYMQFQKHLCDTGKNIAKN